MRVLKFTTEMKIGESLHITPLSDLHLDAAGCDISAFKRLVKERNKLDNHRYIGIGDIGNYILPKDARRYQPSIAIREIRGKDSYLNEVLDYQKRVLKDVDFDMIGMGNHEASVMDHHAIDPTSILCQMLGTQHGGYSGFIQYTIKVKGGGGNSPSTPFRILYHHGAWCGSATRGLPGFKRWASSFEGWDVACMGHNHFSDVSKDVRMGPTARARSAVARDVHFVVCGTHQRGYIDEPGKAPSYEEKKGLPPVAIGAPLIKTTLRMHNDKHAKAMGIPRRYLETTVTI